MVRVAVFEPHCVTNAEPGTSVDLDSDKLEVIILRRSPNSGPRIYLGGPRRIKIEVQSKYEIRKCFRQCAAINFRRQEENGLLEHSKNVRCSFGGFPAPHLSISGRSCTSSSEGAGACVALTCGRRGHEVLSQGSNSGNNCTYLSLYINNKLRSMIQEPGAFIAASRSAKIFPIFDRSAGVKSLKATALWLYLNYTVDLLPIAALTELFSYGVAIITVQLLKR